MKKALTSIFFILSCTVLFAQKSDKPAGTYVLVSVDNIDKDGNKIHLYGDNPQGILMLDGGGHYSLQIMSQSRPRFSSADKSKGTDEENRAAVKGCNTHFGTYVIDEVNSTITFNIAHASFPNWESTLQKRKFTLVNGFLKYIVSSPTTGDSVTGEVVWKRLK